LFAAAALAVSVGLPIAASADQTPPVDPPAVVTPQGHHGGRYMHALHQLTLSSAQQQQIKDAVAQTRSANQNVDKPTRRANMQKLRAQINGILTPDQRTQLRAEIQKERAADGTANPPTHA
jgi:Spy/CpxP family protein refolding chaperone